MHVCTCVGVCVMGCGAGEKHFLFSARLCCGSEPAYQKRLLSITDLDYLPGMSYALVFVQVSAGFNQSKLPEFQGFPFSGGIWVHIRAVACPLRELPAGMAWFLPT